MFIIYIYIYYIYGYIYIYIYGYIYVYIYICIIYMWIDICALTAPKSSAEAGHEAVDVTIDGVVTLSSGEGMSAIISTYV